MIVGFHPDQATEAIIDLALLLKVPFCIVPCCAFPSEFPNRFLPKNYNDTNDEEDENMKEITMKLNAIMEAFTTRKKTKTKTTGRIRVRNYGTLVAYLQRKDKRIRMDELNFPYTTTAKKIVLYMLPEDFL